MLRRKLTRIQLSRDDIQEYERVKREKLAKSKANNQLDSAVSSAVIFPPRGRQTQQERVAEVHRRIGYQPDNVPTDGTQRIM